MRRKGTEIIRRIPDSPRSTAARLMMTATPESRRAVSWQTARVRGSRTDRVSGRKEPTMFYAFLATGCGAFFGACLRYAFGLAFNPLFPTIPLGTLAANLLGGLIMGLTMGAFAQFSSLSPELRLFITTGFLGGLTTFS